MNVNDYCSAPPPLFLHRYAPYKAPFSSASLSDALLKGKATSTGQHRDQYW